MLKALRRNTAPWAARSKADHSAQSHLTRVRTQKLRRLDCDDPAVFFGYVKNACNVGFRLQAYALNIVNRPIAVRACISELENSPTPKAAFRLDFRACSDASGIGGGGAQTEEDLFRAETQREQRAQRF